MKTVMKLFLHRMTNEWKFQIRTWRIAIDWAIAVYVVIPIVICCILTYFDWLKAPPIWLHQMSFYQLALILFFFIIQGNIRVFVDKADMLFLFQQNRWIRQLKKWGIAYSIATNLFVTMLLFMVLFPFLTLYYEIALFQIIIWYVLVVTLKTLNGVNKQLACHYFSGWKSGLVTWLIYLISGIYYGISMLLLDNTRVFFLLIGILVTLLIVLLHHLITLKNTFLMDSAREQTIKLRYVNFIMQTSNAGYRKSSILLFNKKPWIFSRSNRIYKERNAANLLAEACLKSVIRNKNNIYPLLEINALCILMALSMPVSWKWIGLVGFAILFAKTLENFWEKTKYNEYIQLLSWKSEDYRKAAVKATFLLFSIFFLPISFTLGMTAYSWPGVVLFIVLGEIIGYFAVNIVQQFSRYKGSASKIG